MTTEAQPSTMRRKAGAGRPPPEIGRPTAAKVLRAAIVQAADEVAGLVATAGMVDEARTTLASFIETLPEPALLALVEGPGARFGLVVLDAQTVAALIEIQTTGRVVARPAEPRAPTRTDAIMCADVIDRFLELLEQRAAEAELEVAPAISGFRYGLALAEPRAIMMTLEDIPYRTFRFEIDLGNGAKTGTVQLLLPYDPLGAANAGAAETRAFAEAIRAQVLETHAVLSATLFKRKMTVAEVAGLEVGFRLVLPRAALANIAVEAVDGAVVAQGRLGQVNGYRAVRLTTSGAAELSAPQPEPLGMDRPAADLAAPEEGTGPALPGDREGTANPEPNGLADFSAPGDPGSPPGNTGG